MTVDRPVSIPPTVLLFGPLDPTSAQFLTADALSCTHNGCHPVTVATAVHIQDTTALDHIKLLAPEYVHDQMRCLLEDLQIDAIKAGPLYTVEQASVLGQIMADYAHLPLVLHLQSIPESGQVGTDQDIDEIVDAIFDLALPFADLVVADQLLLQQWQADGHLAARQHPARSLIELGARAVLYTAAHIPEQANSYQLYTRQGRLKQWPYISQTARIQDTEGMLACVCATQLAWGRDLATACDHALQFIYRATEHVFQAGMGTRLINQSALCLSARTNQTDNHEA